jgi:hypothetical protein
MSIRTLADLNESSSYAWPGGYPVAFYDHSGGILCYDCVEAELFAEVDADYDGTITTFESSVEDGDQQYYGGVMCDGCNEYIVPPCCPDCGDELYDGSALLHADNVDASLMHRRCAAKLVCEPGIEPYRGGAKRLPGIGIGIVATKDTEYGWDNGAPWYAPVGTIYSYK